MTSTVTATEGEVFGADLGLSESGWETYDFNMFMWQTRDLHSLDHLISPLFHMGLQTWLAEKNLAKATTQAHCHPPQTNV